MGELKSFDKSLPIITNASLHKIRNAIRNKDWDYLSKLYLRTMDPIQLIFIEEFFAANNQELPEPFEEPPKRYA